VEAREHALAVDMNGACAALPVVAPLLCSGQRNGFAYAIE